MFPSLRIEGALLAAELLERIEALPGQRPADFGLDAAAQVKDEIAQAWVRAQVLWRRFRRVLDALPPQYPATRETRQRWVLPLLGLLGYRLQGLAQAEVLEGRPYPLSHRAPDRAGTVVHVLGWHDPAGLDRRPPPRPGAPRLSAHALLQEYLGRSEGLYGLLSNGRVLRLLRDSPRLVRPSCLEFDLERLFGEGLFADFALLWRLLHASRLPVRRELAPSCWLERYHQDSLAAGSRIRAGLSRAVEQALKGLANGFLQHPANGALRERLRDGALDTEALHQQLLRLIYRLLFLMVIEERGLVFPPGLDARRRGIYTRCYGLQRLRRLSEQRHLADSRHADLWPALLSTFALFEAGASGPKLGLAPLAGELFSPTAIADLAACALGNDALLPALRALSLYPQPGSGQLVRVNYGALNVEELGSIYEGLLEYAPVILWQGARPVFDFRRGEGRAHTGAHYTPDELVQPLLQHSLEHLVAQALKAPDPAAALLALRVADVACGSGHILLAAARRIAVALARVRSGEDQPSPAAFREAVREVIRRCIYGVDLNPLAVALCKLALWLEAHVPGEPLGFLDHHIKCGNAIVGSVRRENLARRGVPDEAFRCLPGDDREVAAALRRRNRAARRGQAGLDFDPPVLSALDVAVHDWQALDAMPERNPQEVAARQARCIALSQSPAAQWMRRLAALPIAQFYLPKRAGQEALFVTEDFFRACCRGTSALQGPAVEAAEALAARKRFFHWFLEFPEVMARGGFDCVLGNPPYLGGQALSGTYGQSFCSYMRWEYAPVGMSDLVVYFVRRMFDLLRPGGFMAFLSTNSIKDGDVREGGLEQILRLGGCINFAERGIEWLGRANMVVAAVAVSRGEALVSKVLDGKAVLQINDFLEEGEKQGLPGRILSNVGKMFQGCIFLGDGFVLTNDDAEALITANGKNGQVIFPLINGQELNNEPMQQPVRKIINFFDWPAEVAARYIEPFCRVERLVRPVRTSSNRAVYREKWWLYAEPRPGLSSKLKRLKECFVVAANTKYLNFSRVQAGIVFTHTTFVFPSDRWDFYAVLQSTLHELWARKYSGTLKQDLRYSPSRCFETFAFPAQLWETPSPELAALGERYHAHRRQLMQELWLGLTDVYNLFHAQHLTPALVQKISKKPAEVAQAGYTGLLELRRLHVALDCAVRDAYGWQDLNLGHDFFAVDTLPEKDRVRFTLCPAARRELLGRLLTLNQERAATQEPGVKAVNTTRVPECGFRGAPGEPGTAALFGET